MDLSNQVSFDELTNAAKEGILYGFSDSGCLIHLDKFVWNTKPIFQKNPKTSIETYLKNQHLKWKTAGRHRDRFLNNS